MRSRETAKAFFTCADEIQKVTKGVRVFLEISEINNNQKLFKARSEALKALETAETILTDIVLMP